MNNMLKRKAINLFRYFKDLINSEEGLIARKIGSHIMYLDPRDGGISATLRKSLPGDPDREPAFMKTLRQELQAGMVALDLGANLGHITLIMAQIVGPSGKVYAVEPSPHNFRILSKNILANGYSKLVSAFQMGVSNRNGNMLFYVSDKTNLGSMTLTQHANHDIEVRVETIDCFFENKRRPNFIKMDIEGHEVEALEGMYRTAKEAIPPFKILMEVHPMYYSEEHSLEAQLRRFLALGFYIKYVISAGTAAPDFFKNHGYRPEEIFQVGRFQRAIYTDVSNEHAVIAACREHRQYVDSIKGFSKKIVRAIMIEKLS